MLQAYNLELKKFIDRGALVRLTQEELDSYGGPISYVTHHSVLKPESVSTPLRVVTNTSLKNVTAGFPLMNTCRRAQTNCRPFLKSL